LRRKGRAWAGGVDDVYPLAWQKTACIFGNFRNFLSLIHIYILFVFYDEVFVMRKIFAIFVLGALLAFVSATDAQAQAFKKGSLIGEAGFTGVGLYGAIESGVTDKIGPGYIGVGGALGVPLWFGFGLYAGAEGNYHFEIPAIPQLDLAAGVGLFIFPLGNLYVTPTINLLGRFYFTDKIGIALRGNYGFIGFGAGGALGVAIKL
jgi:hypothetical protein